MGFQEINSAIYMRNLIASIAEDVVNRIRPETKMGKVFSYNVNSQTAQILFPGETTSSLVTAHFSKSMIPRVAMDVRFAELTYGAPGDVVRVAGKPGSYWICDYVTGTPQVDGGQYMTGTLMMWPSPTSPPGFFSCHGGTFDGSIYRQLAALCGDQFGTHSGDTYYLPDFRARMPVGIGGTAVPAQQWAYAFSIGQKYGSHRHNEVASHYHGMEGHAFMWGIGGLAGQVSLSGTQAYAGGPSGNEATTSQGGWNRTHNAGSDPNAGIENTPAALGINFIVKN